MWLWCHHLFSAMMASSSSGVKSLTMLKVLADGLCRLPLHHRRHLRTAEVQQRLHVHVIRSENQLKQHLLVHIHKVCTTAPTQREAEGEQKGKESKGCGGEGGGGDHGRVVDVGGAEEEVEGGGGWTMGWCCGCAVRYLRPIG